MTPLHQTTGPLEPDPADVVPDLPPGPPAPHPVGDPTVVMPRVTSVGGQARSGSDTPATTTVDDEIEGGIEDAGEAAGDEIAEAEAAQESAAHASARNIGLGAVWNVLAYVLPQVMTLVLSVLVARKLGPELQGIQSYLMFIAMTVGTVYGLGLPSAVEQSISRLLGEERPEVARAFGLWAARSTTIPALLSFATVVLVGRVQYTDYAWAWVGAAVAGSVITTHATVAQGLNGLHEFRVPSTIGMLSQLFTSFVCAGVLLLGGGVLEFVVVQTIGGVASAVITMMAFVRRLPPPGNRVPRRALDVETKTALSFAGVSGIVVLLETIVTRRSEFVFLSLFHHDLPQEIAFYSVAFAAAAAVAAVPAALNSVALPVVSRLIAAGDADKVRLGYHSAQRLLLNVASVAAGGMLGCGSALVLLAYGEQYEQSARLLLIVTVAPIVAAPLGGLASASLLGAGVPKAAVRAQLIAAVVTVVADIALVWPFKSYGAAAAAVLGILAGTWSLMREGRRALGAPPLGLDAWWSSAVTVAVTAAPGLFFMLTGVPHLVTLLVGAVLGLLLVGTFWAVLKPLTPEHLYMIGTVVNRLPPRGKRLLDSFVSYQGRRRKDWDLEGDDADSALGRIGRP